MTEDHWNGEQLSLIIYLNDLIHEKIMSDCEILEVLANTIYNICRAQDKPKDAYESVMQAMASTCPM